MLGMFYKQKIKEYISLVKIYVTENFVESSSIENTVTEESAFSSNDEIIVVQTEKSVFKSKVSGKRRACDSPEQIFSEISVELNETFTDAVNAYIRSNGMKESEIYKRAGIDRRLFSKIMCDREYKPSKDTAIAVAIGLMLSLEETKDLLARAGYTLSHSIKRDLIIEYFFKNKIYVITDINQVLYSLGQRIIGR